MQASARQHARYPSLSLSEFGLRRADRCVMCPALGAFGKEREGVSCLSKRGAGQSCHRGVVGRDREGGHMARAGPVLFPEHREGG